jgi:3'(2'), 5'-bisphosphate nucleotidase
MKKLKNMTEWLTWIPELLRIARTAGEVILEIYHDPSSFRVEQKADNTPITRADRASNEMICKALAALTPDWPIISEENELPPYEERRHWSYCWIVDPLDGTKEFIRRNGDFCVNIALAKEGRAVLGVIYAPVTEECFWAVQGQGAFEVSAKGDQRLHCASFGIDDAGLRILSSRSHFNPATQAWIGGLREPKFVNKGSAIKFGMLARGDADLYPRLGPTGEWDTAAGQVIVEEAGGAVLDFYTRQPLQYNKENTLNPFFMARGALQSEE